MRWPRKLLPSPIPRLDDQVSIWSVTARDARTFFRIVIPLWLVALAYIGYKTRESWSADDAAAEPVWRNAGDHALAGLTELGGVGIGIVVFSVLMTRVLNTTGGILMTLYEAMANRFVFPVIEKHEARGYAKGLQEGIERAEQVEARWRAWNDRRLAAARDGRAFDEQPPGS